MIEDALRRQLQPVADRHRRLYLAKWLSLVWLVAAGAGFLLVLAAWLWAWRSATAVGILLVGTVLATIWILYRSRRLQPDYRELARRIEHQHPDLKALLLTAVEQEPEGPDGNLGYMQQQVLVQAAGHASNYKWSESISTTRLVLADVGRIAALLVLLVVLAQVTLPVGVLPGPSRGLLPGRDSEVTVTPGDTSVEVGAPVVVLARFEGELPPSAELLFGPPEGPSRRIALSKNLDDPVFGGVIDEVRSNTVYRVVYGDQRTRDFTITVFENPELLRVDARVTYPEYTGLDEKLIEDTRQISVVEGSNVALRFVLNKPVRTARLRPTDGLDLGLSIDSEDPNVLVTSLTAVKTEKYELHMADADGRRNKLPPRFAIEVHRNRPPEVTPVFPNRDLVVSPLEEVDLEAKVADDYGLRGYGLNYALAGQPPRDIVLSETGGPAEGPQIRHRLALEELGAEPDQLLTYYFWADDIGPEGEVRRTASDIYFAEVRHFEEIFRESQSQQGQGQQGQQQSPGDQLARLQKQIITATWNIRQQAVASGGVERHKDDLDVVRQAQADAMEQAGAAMTQVQDPTAAQALQAATGHMETALDHLTTASESGASAELTPALGAEQSAYQELLKLRNREHQVARGQNASQSGGGANASSRSQEQLEQLELTQRENRYESRRYAQSQEQTAQREDLQILNRLRDLARRQNEVSERLKEAEAALRQARNEQERQDALRELKRLRDEQMQAMRDMDELRQRMDRPQNRQRMAEAREQLDQSRSEVRRSAEALQEGMTSRAVTSTTRAQRQLEQMREEFQRRTSSQFADQMRDMRENAREIDTRQKDIARQIEEQMDTRQKRLADSGTTRELTEEVERQREEASELIEQMKAVSDEAQISEPLLSRELYDTLRQTNPEELDQTLETTGELLSRSFLPQARDVERRAAQEIERLREGVEEAADSVLGDEAESLRLARRQLEELIRQADREASQADPNRATARADSGSPSQRPQPPMRDAGRAEGRPPSDRGQDTGDTRRAQGQSPSGEPSESQRQGQSPQDRTARGQGSEQDSPQQGQARGGSPRWADGAERNDPQGWGGGPGNWDEAGVPRPLTGDEYMEWSDALRDVEEMLTERELREEAARVRDRARAMRIEFKRHGKEPQWDLVRTQVIEPLAELRQQVGERLAQLQSDEAMVPIDRDPVPERFAELIRTYFENLGREQQ